ncbi:hypothetical protein ACQBAR_09060 [Propionibacteriaceae bacterium Y1685]|uniref:hypothetical protein n=1 Tax=Microlunatus sp. Y1700 TaxID=3418487 RepID=UPI003B7D4220
MSLVRVNNIAVSLDGYATGEGQSHEAPFGHAGERLHTHQVATRSMHRLMGQPGGRMGIDDAMTQAYFDGVGAEIMGRNKFGPVREEWDEVASGGAQAGAEGGGQS